MLNVQINVGGGNPKVSLNEKLRNELAQTDQGMFEFNHERFIEGLELAGVPEPAIDSLQLDFRKVRDSNTVANSSYSADKHLLTTVIGTSKPTPGNLTKNQGAGPWKNDFGVQSRINYGLAHQAQYIADIALRHPDTLVGAREGAFSYSRRMTYIVLAGAVGSPVGAELASSSGWPIWIGAALGFAGGAVADIAVGVTHQSVSSKHKEAGRAIDAAYNANRIRAEKFANRQDVFDIFKGVIQIKLVDTVRSSQVPQDPREVIDAVLKSTVLS